MGGQLLKTTFATQNSSLQGQRQTKRKIISFVRRYIRMQIKALGYSEVFF